MGLSFGVCPTPGASDQYEQHGHLDQAKDHTESPHDPISDIRTRCHDAIPTPAGEPPVEHQAQSRKSVHERIRALGALGKNRGTSRHTTRFQVALDERQDAQCHARANTQEHGPLAR